MENKIDLTSSVYDLSPPLDHYSFVLSCISKSRCWLCNQHLESAWQTHTLRNIISCYVTAAITNLIVHLPELLLFAYKDFVLESNALQVPAWKIYGVLREVCIICCYWKLHTEGYYTLYRSSLDGSPQVLTLTMLHLWQGSEILHNYGLMH